MLARGLPRSYSIATAVRMVSKPLVWTPNFVPVEFEGEKDFPESARFRLASYNILAQAYVKSSLFPHTPSSCLKWKNRSQQILSRIVSLDADLLCVQELDEYESFYKAQLESKGYSSIYVQRTGKKRDGCGIFYRHEWCELLEHLTIDYNDLVPAEARAERSKGDVDEDDRDVSDPYVRFRRNCVGILTAFRFPRAPDNVVVLANTHLYWDPNLQDVKLAQAKYLLAKLDEFDKEIAKKFSTKTVVLVAGDFNSVPGDLVYNYLTSAKESELKSFEKELKVPAVPLYSLYATVQGEPEFTNCTPDFTGTLDYIFYRPSDSLRPCTFLELPRLNAPDVVGGLPNHAHPSDHIPVAADFSIS